MRTLYSWLIIFVLAIMCLAVSAMADEKDIIETIGPAKVNWTTQYIEVTGEGLIPSPADEADRSKAVLKARTYAKMSAVAGIYAALDGMIVSNTTVGKQVLSDSNIRRKIEGYVRNVETVSEKKVNNGADEVSAVTLRAPMYGDNGIIPAVLEYAMDQDETTRKIKLDKDNVEDVPSIASDAKGTFTSLIIESTSLKLDKAVLFRIRRPDLTDVFSAKAVKYDKDRIEQIGLAVYVSNKDEATKQRRAGNNPLVVKGRQKAGIDEMCDIVISNPDADYITEANKTGKFIEKGNVIIIVDLRKEE